MAQGRVGARPGSGQEQFFSRTSTLAGADETLLGFGANALVEVAIVDGQAKATFYTVEDGQYVETAAGLPVAVSGSTLEVAVPYEVVGKPNAGDVVKLRAVLSEGEQRDMVSVPGSGPAELLISDLGLTTPVLTIDDPEGDDHGPGSYRYPGDSVFQAKTYDLKQFAVSEDEANLIAYLLTFSPNYVPPAPAP